MAVIRPAYRERLGHVFRPRGIFGETVEVVPFSMIPWQVARLLPRLAAKLYASWQPTFSRQVRALGFATPEILFLDEPRLLGMCRHFRPGTLIYRATDLYHEMLGDKSVIEAERAALARADGFVATSQPVYEHLRALAPEKPGLVVENGVDYELFHAPQPEPADIAMLPRPRAVYVGALDGRFDYRAVEELATARPAWSFVLIGPKEQLRTSRNIPGNIFLLGTRAYESIPGYLQHSDLALLPLSAHAANRGRSPMKIYEYGAAGLPVVATETSELARRKLPFVELYRERMSFADALDRSYAHRDTQRNHAIQSSAAMSWTGRLRLILDFVSSLREEKGEE
jgi:glycosyltransferase involved in cell wall biosynthesis